MTKEDAQIGIYAFRTHTHMRIQSTFTMCVLQFLSQIASILLRCQHLTNHLTDKYPAIYRHTFFMAAYWICSYLNYVRSCVFFCRRLSTPPSSSSSSCTSFCCFSELFLILSFAPFSFGMFTTLPALSFHRFYISSH